MKFFNKFNTIFNKLIAYFIILTIIITALIGFTSYTYFSSAFYDELKTIDSKILEHLKKIIDETIIEKVEYLSYDLTTEQNKNNDLLFFFKYPTNGNSVKIHSISDYLRNTVASYSNLIDSIYIYYPENNVLISSSTGVNFLESKSDLSDNIDWFNKINNMTENSIWIKTRKVQPNNLLYNNSSDLLTYVRFYPYSFSENSDGFIAISIKESAFYNVIKQTIPDEYSSIFLLDSSGDIISHSNKDKLYEVLVNEQYIQHIINSPEPSDSFIRDLYDDKSFLSFVTLKHDDWKLVNITPVEQFLKKSVLIQRTLILICIIALFIGLIISNIFTFNIYNPLKSIINHSKKMFTNTQDKTKKTQNEYTLINTAFNNLSVKVDQLETTLKNNMPLIKYNLVSGLFNNTIKNITELNERLNLLNLSINWRFSSCMIVEFDQNLLNKHGVRNFQFIKYDIINQIEEFSDDYSNFVAIELSDLKIGVIVNSQNNSNIITYKLAYNVTSYITSNYKISAVIALGNQVLDPLLLYNSFNDTQILMKYSYFMPDEKTLIGKTLLSRELDNAEMPDKVFDTFSKGLKIGSLDTVKKTISVFVNYSKNGNYSADYCHNKMINILSILSQYITDMNLNTEDFSNISISEKFKPINNILEFEQCLLTVVTEIFNFIDNMNKNSEVIEKAIDIITNNLNIDLSLDFIADKVSLSPSYFSKIFKDEIGTTFVSFVTQKRMVMAKELLLTTNHSVEQIALKAGYNSATYFIKNFKEFHGMSPNKYRYSKLN